MMPLDTVYVRHLSDGRSISDVQSPDMLEVALDKMAQGRVQVRTCTLEAESICFRHAVAPKQLMYF